MIDRELYRGERPGSQSECVICGEIDPICSGEQLSTRHLEATLNHLGTIEAATDVTSDTNKGSAAMGNIGGRSKGCNRCKRLKVKVRSIYISQELSAML